MTSGYVLIIIWIAIAPVLLKAVDTHEEIIVAGRKEYRYKFIWAFIIFFPVIIMAGTRGSIGDTDSYRQMFQDMPQTFSALPQYFETLEKDKGFFLCSSIIKIIIGNNDTIYFMIIAFIQGISLVIAYRKFSSNYVMSIFLFLISSDYISWMFNGMRQFIAVSVTFACIGLILDNKRIKLIITILLMATIHGTALMMIPFAFMAKGRAWNKKTMMFIIAVVAAVVFVGRFTNLLDTALADTQYQNVVSDWEEFQDDGTSVLRVLVYAVPTILSYIGRRRIWEEDNPVINLSANMSIASTGLYVVSMFTSGIMIGRLPIYLSLYNYILLPWEIENLFTERSKKIVYIFMISAYIVFYYYQMHMTWNYF